MLPLPDAHNVCTRAKNHHDPQAGQELFAASSDVVSTVPSQAASGAGDTGLWVAGFQQTHEQMKSRNLFLLNSIDHFSTQPAVGQHYFIISVWNARISHLTYVEFVVL
jgi:hypothetical protein